MKPRKAITLVLLASFCVALQASPQTLTVTTTADSGPGSLRQAILDSNGSAGIRDTIAFNITGAGPHVIAPLTALPAITQPVTIDGYTQDGSSVNTAADGNNAVLKIVINALFVAAEGDGLSISTSECVVRGLVIKNFSGAGIGLNGPGLHLVEGNFIGTDAAGETNTGNRVGIRISQDCVDNLIGGPTPAARNVIAGNVIGISIEDADDNKIEGNFIGTDVAGTASVPNKQGVFISRASGVSIGGTTAAQRNVISGNANDGIAAFGCTGLIVLGNYIGTQVDGTSALGNQNCGVSLNRCKKCVIGQVAAAAANVIAHNGRVGVVVIDATSAGNQIRGNRIFTNGELGIDLQRDQVTTIITLLGVDRDGLQVRDLYDGVTENDLPPDEDKGANRLQNFPVLISAEKVTGGGKRITGDLRSTPSAAFDIDFYGNETRDRSGHGEGQFYIGTIRVTTDGQGEANFDTTFAAAQGAWISSTATRVLTSDTSEFSGTVPCKGQQFGVNNTNNSGPGSFAQAILDSNANGNPDEMDEIVFAIGGSGPHVIALTAAFATITEPVNINGSTQPGALPNTIDFTPHPVSEGAPAAGSAAVAALPPVSDDAVIQIHLDGTALVSGIGLKIAADGVTVSGIAFTGFSNSAIECLSLNEGVIIQGCYIGIEPDGTAGGNGTGILMSGADNGIGGHLPAHQNVIAANTVDGIHMLNPGMRVGMRRNLIGVGRDGGALGNGRHGIFIPNTSSDITISDSAIAHNTLRGVLIDNAPRISVRDTVFGSNGDLAIERLPSTGPNDPVPGAVGNRPVLEAAFQSSGTTIAGTINGPADTGFEIQLFANSECEPFFGAGEGEELLTTLTAITDELGDGSFAVHLTETIPAGQFISATATDPSGTTSEFSDCLAVVVTNLPAGSPACMLFPALATNDVDTVHAVTVFIASGDIPAAGVSVAFNITAGPNSGTNDVQVTDGNGAATFAYDGTGGPGTDIIRAIATIGGASTTCTATKVWIEAGPTVECSLAPASDTNLVGQIHTVTATITSNGVPVPGVGVGFSVTTGPHAGENGSDTTDENGQAVFMYMGSTMGADTIMATGLVSGVSFSCSATIQWVAPPTALTCSLAPATATNLLGSTHMVTATVSSNGAPLSGVSVDFDVISGPNAGNLGTDATDGGGEATFQYTGDGGIGTDLIQATGMVGGNSFTCTATKTWIASSVLCSVTPQSATNQVGTEHEFIVTVTTNGGPASGVTVDAMITAGPHVGKSALAITDGSGVASFIYMSEGVLGTDTIMATGIVSGVSFSCSATKVWVAGACPDLSGVWTNVVQTCKVKNEVTSCKVKGTLMVQNIGTEDADTSFVRYFLSSDETFDKGDTLLKQVATGAVKLSKPKKRTLSAKLPVGVDGSGQYIIAVIDADEQIAECNELNNIVVFGPLP